MYFAIYCRDKPGQPEVRQGARAEHLRYLNRYRDRTLIAGPMLGDDGAPVGSLLVMDFEDRATAETFAAGDPYAQAGVFESVAITPWKKVFPAD